MLGFPTAGCWNCYWMLGFPLDPGVPAGCWDSCWITVFLLGVGIPSGSKDPARSCNGCQGPQWVLGWVPGFLLGAGFLLDPGVLLGARLPTGCRDFRWVLGVLGIPGFPLDSPWDGCQDSRGVPGSLPAAGFQLTPLQVRVSYFSEAGGVPMGRAVLYLTGVEVSLDVDVNRSGAVSRTLLDKASWTWGPDGHGAVLLVNCDRDDPDAEGLDNEDSAVRSYNDLQDMSQAVLRTRGPRAIFAGHRLLLHVDFGDADKLRVFHGGGGEELEKFKHVLGGSKLAYTVRPGRHCHESVFYVEGLAFPDVAFPGLVSLHVTLLEGPEKSQGLLESPIFTDTVVFRVAPWIMTPNTQQPLEVFVCSVADNEGFVAAVGALAERARCPLTVCPAPQNRQDRWIQDEVEFGYVQAPHKTFPVVFDSPRDRGLKDFPVRSILGPDFGYVARQAPEGASSLDSFGNLEVSPPVTVRGKEYPLGRILIGSSFPRVGGRRMAKAVREFLVAQKVQAPVELFSDWLQVGHVDEFLSFVPAPDRKGFRLLLASPSACYQLLREKQEEGYGEAALFQGLDRVPKPTINEILANEELRRFNDYAQSCISWNRDTLKRSLGLAEPDIVDIPQLFQGDAASGAVALFPDMVNMLVLGRHLGIPKPFGPVVGGRCCLEQRVRELLEPLGLSCTFIDDFFSYHVLLGEVHCGTNVRRKPFAFKWWHVVP